MTASLATASRIRRPSTASRQNSLICEAQQALIERADDDAAEHGAEHGSRAAEDVDAADHDRGD